MSAAVSVDRAALGLTGVDAITWMQLKQVVEVGTAEMDVVVAGVAVTDAVEGTAEMDAVVAETA